MELYNACERGDEEAVLSIIRSGATINVLVGKHRVRRTALHCAAEYGYLNIVTRLISKGADANIKSSNGHLPLHDACVGGHQDIVQYLISCTHEIDCMNDQGQTAAHVASYQGETQCLKVLLQNDCDISVKDGSQRSCLDLAVILDHGETVNLLLQSKANLVTNADGWSAIHGAAQRGAVKSLKMFRKHNANLCCADAKGIMPVHIAAKHGKIKALDFLLSAGSTFANVDNIGRSTVHFAAASASSECLHWVLERCTNIGGIDGNGNTPAHYAGMDSKSAKLVNCFYNHGANFEIENKNGDTPFYCAKKAGYPVAFQKALSDDIVCESCEKKNAKFAYDETHKPSAVEKSISQQQSALYNVDKFTRSKSKTPSPRKNPTKNVSPTDRNLAARYYGEELYDASTALASKNSRGNISGTASSVKPWRI